MRKTLTLTTAALAAALFTLPAVAQTSTSPTSPTSPVVRAPNTATPAPSMAPGTTHGMSSSTTTTADAKVRVSKIIGSSVYNEKNEKIGSIDDLLVAGDNDVKEAVISVGGFLGIGNKLVKVRYDQLKINGDTIVMTGASKDQLSQLPGYSYTTASR